MKELKIFGWHRDEKLALNTIAHIHLGYDLNHKRYRIYHSQTEKIFVSSKLNFDQDSCPVQALKETI